ncbi:hypothetical protein AAD018_010910 [Aestuariibius insulae]|uniref:hypothetical protein n=1 Tax=Aestuariibius insulae TaxID=2058287 RepID=UPI00345EE564
MLRLVSLILLATPLGAQTLPEGGTRSVPDLLARGGTVEATGAMGGSPLIYVRVPGEGPELWVCRADYPGFEAFADPLRSAPPSSIVTVCSLLR